MSDILKAARKGNIDELTRLINNGVDVNYSDHYGYTALMQAAISGQTKALTYLIDNGANVECEDGDGITPLMHAAAEGQYEAIVCLIARGASVNRTDHDGCTALTYACTLGETESVDCLIENGADFEIENKYGLAPITFAARAGHDYTVSYLIDKGVDLEALKYLYPSSKAPLRFYSIDILCFIIEAGGDIPFERLNILGYEKEKKFELILSLEEKFGSLNKQINQVIERLDASKNICKDIHDLIYNVCTYLEENFEISAPYFYKYKVKSFLLIVTRKYLDKGDIENSLSFFQICPSLIKTYALDLSSYFLSRSLDCDKENSRSLLIAGLAAIMQSPAENSHLIYRILWRLKNPYDMGMQSIVISDLIEGAALTMSQAQLSLYLQKFIMTHPWIDKLLKADLQDLIDGLHEDPMPQEILDRLCQDDMLMDWLETKLGSAKIVTYESILSETLLLRGTYRIRDLLETSLEYGLSSISQPCSEPALECTVTSVGIFSVFNERLVLFEAPLPPCSAAPNSP